MTVDVIVRIEHARAARLAGAGVQCAPGIRQWFARHDLSLVEFLANGLPASRLRPLNCPFADRAIAAAEEASRGQQ